MDSAITPLTRAKAGVYDIANRKWYELNVEEESQTKMECKRVHVSNRFTPLFGVKLRIFFHLIINRLLISASDHIYFPSIIIG